MAGMYILYSNKAKDEEIQEEFASRHGYRPSVIVRTGGGSLAGPLKTDDTLRYGESGAVVDLRKVQKGGEKEQ